MNKPKAKAKAKPQSKSKPSTNDLLEYGILRQMDIQNSDYPLTIPTYPRSTTTSSRSGPLLPSSLEFAQMVHANVPVKFNKAAAGGGGDWFPAMKLWNTEGYLATKLKDTLLSVAETPFGNADAPVDGAYFVQPFVRYMKGSEFFSGSGSGSGCGSDDSGDVSDVGESDHGEVGDGVVEPKNKNKTTTATATTIKRPAVQYMQSQDNNFPREFPTLIHDAPHSLEFADTALFPAKPEPTTAAEPTEPTETETETETDKQQQQQQPFGPSAVNLWIGKDQETVSRLHNDNYENLYIQVSGTKEIYLIPPGDAYALDERFLESAQYNCDMEMVVDIDIDSSSSSTTTTTTKNTTKKHAPKPKVLFPTVDPSDPSTHTNIYTHHALVYREVLEPGDMLYLPALWYHQVAVLDVSPVTGLNVSVNYWYPACATNGQWMRWDYVRLTALVLRGYHDTDYFELEDEDEDEEEDEKEEEEEEQNNKRRDTPFE